MLRRFALTNHHYHPNRIIIFGTRLQELKNAIPKNNNTIFHHHQQQQQVSSFTTTTSAAKSLQITTTPSFCHKRRINNNNNNNNNVVSTFTTGNINCYSTTAITPFPIDEFRDSVPHEKRMNEIVGRSWSVKELRRKSFDDLHKLWYVLYKELNMLHTELHLSRRHRYPFPQKDRFQKVRKSMGAIKQVLGERKRIKIQQHLQQKELEALEEEEEVEEEEATTTSRIPEKV